ncbi:hypothetical protein B0H17DRAFT_1196117 [Mycena rosella]|uniref:Uncharacterized protein n=1 Tax=Mycena rosella TaxID=1033263 RepID=A0AAD7DVS5_MYCRO|nr:hypothetical protein B0H17DRAFT_1196117 [Mycena rosella]
MSHLTASPFHKPSPFEFPQRTEAYPQSSAHPPAQLPTPASIAGPDIHSSEYFETPAASISPEASSRFRRVASSIVYHNSGLRESRERTVQRSSRTFVVVLPPPSLPQDHGHLGHTLSSGPRHRLSQGLLMPLFPTMYGQLSAIAREYNFPSTTGLCLYLHFTDNGITVTPRISDDSWQMIWNHAFDPTPSTSATPPLPISGKIEFDIDLRLARWYGAWMASSHREHVDVPMSVTPSAAPSIIHYREESNTTFADGDDQDIHSVVRPGPSRHVPRKLSLIDRFDAMSARSVPRSVMARAPPPPPPTEPLPGSQNLSPIFQEDEPKTAKYDLEHRVNSWRASASVLPGAIAEAGHTLSNLPNSPLDESPMPTASNEDEYRIEDYSFSISSAGPGDYDPYSPLTWYYDPSVHLAHRAQGSVCMTPSDCTSFGPSDYTLPDYFPSLDLDGVRTPDIAHRMFEDVPASPSVATSWGVPLSYPASPTSEYRAPSVDLGERQCFSRPMTPMTATSWGAPESFPPSPTTPFYVHTPDAGQRTFDLSALSEQDAPWSMVWPYHNTARPWAQVWPYHMAQDAAQEEIGQSVAARDISPAVYAAASGALIGTALLATTGDVPWSLVWPYHSSQTTAREMGQSVTTQNISPAVYPHFDLYPAASTARLATARDTRAVNIRLVPAYPAFDLYPATYPGNLDEIYPANTVDDAPLAISTRLSPRYPTFDLYPAVYPHVVPYPAFQYEMEALSTPVSSSSQYPHFNLYPAIGTSMAQTYSSSSSGSVTVVLRTAYPVFNLYPALYPAFDIYPAFDNGAASLDHDSVLIRLTTAYPIFDLYPAVYPVFDLYPALPDDCWGPTVLSAGYPDFDIYPAASRSRQALTSSRVLSAGYPDFDIYPTISRSRQAPISPRVLSAGYPDFDIYPATSRSRQAPTSHRILSAGYPDFDIYPATSRSRQGPPSSRVLSAGYPDFDIYPATSRSRQGPPSSRVLSAGYPDFDIYPAASGSRQAPVSSRVLSVGYPDFDIYPAASRSRQAPTSSRVLSLLPALEFYPQAIRTSTSTPPLPDSARLWDKICRLDQLQTPRIQSTGSTSPRGLSAGYPDFDIYPAASRSRRAPISVRLPASYPIFDLYPPVYPILEIYPEIPGASARDSGVSIRLAVCYPIFNLYPAVYPTFEIYPSLPEECTLGPEPRIYPPTGYPHFNLYPPANGHAVVAVEKRSEMVCHPVKYPNFNLYPAVYPNFDLYPEVWKTVDIRGVNVGQWLGTRLSICIPQCTHSLTSRYPYFNLYPAIYPHFDLWPTLSSMQAPRVPKQSRFTRSDLHALVKKAPSQSQRNVRAPSKTHEALHLAMFPRGSDVLTPSGTIQHTVRKTHLDLHRNVFPSAVQTPSGTEVALKVEPAPSRAGAPKVESAPSVTARKIESAPIGALNAQHVLGASALKVEAAPSIRVNFADESTAVPTTGGWAVTDCPNPADVPADDSYSCGPHCCVPTDSFDIDKTQRP